MKDAGSRAEKSTNKPEENAEEPVMHYYSIFQLFFKGIPRKKTLMR